MKNLQSSFHCCLLIVTVLLPSWRPRAIIILGGTSTGERRAKLSLVMVRLSSSKAGNCATWPGLTYKNVAKYCPAVAETSNGHMAQPRQNVRSTKPKQPSKHFSKPINSDASASANELHVCVLGRGTIISWLLIITNWIQFSWLLSNIVLTSTANSIISFRLELEGLILIVTKLDIYRYLWAQEPSLVSDACLGGYLGAAGAKCSALFYREDAHLFNRQKAQIESCGAAWIM